MDILLGIVLSIIAGIIPTIIYGWFVYWLDRHEKEPWWLLALAFCWGMVPAVLIALIAQILLDIPTTWVFGNDNLAYDVVGGSVWAPITEEITKGLGVLLIVLIARREIDNILDGIVYGAMAGLGFAFTENVFYFLGALTENGFGDWVITILLRTIPFGLNHAFFTGVFGASVGYALLTHDPVNRIVMPIVGLAAAMIFHGLHNFGASLASLNCFSILLSLLADWGGLLLLGILVWFIWRQEREWILTHLSTEIPPDTLYTLTTWSEWQSARWGALLRGDIATWRWWGQLQHVGAELAFKKQRIVQFGSNTKTEGEIALYQHRLRAMGVMNRES